MQIEKYIAERKKTKEILIMTHQIIGYPDFETNEKAIDCFYKNGVDMIELQIPFSDPVADGPAFAKSNQAALEKGVKVKQCLDFIEKISGKYPITFLIMTYYNILYQYGVPQFVKKCKEINVKGIIVPDAAIDEAHEYYEGCSNEGISAITIASPYSDKSRIEKLSIAGDGFIYYVPRKGVTGCKTDFNLDVLDKISLVKEYSGKNVAVGFGIQNQDDVKRLVGVADIAIIGSKIQKVIEDEGIEALDNFIKSICSVN
ncbi:tryptophan synthase subunit alpha [Alkaliphilus peptidifermentans]|uniref:Tryptophan synthase alpha chain n=1 Tax=Alkaliphilus peptidifermentans DSM 18978 TaxID=1120976 RepID=A0A1G5JPY5_9FIRM|nr:tryptophan synthase subunit alpha [Alkaliphilus peptidifermentans]SCY90406.1 tryptophan synthase, alpha chain [Alkaliphilus peptidifermentans DSM 18978]